MTLQTIFKWIFLPDIKRDESAENVRITIILNGSNVLAIFLLIIDCILFFIRQQYSDSDLNLNFLILIILILNFSLFKLINSLNTYKAISCFTALVYCSVIFFYGSSSNYDFIWSLLFPMLAYIFTGFRLGTVLAILYILFFYVIFFSGEKFTSLVFSRNFIIPFTHTYCFIAILSFILEYSRDRAQMNYNKLIENLDMLSRTDELTGLLNRRGIIDFMKYEFRKRTPGETHFTICICDIDFFKRINDTYGHDCGDLILRELSGFIKSLLRAGDLISRWGGEEFIILMTNISIDESASVLERIRSYIEKKEFSIAGKIEHITMSFGISEASESKTLDELINLADMRLYHAKGRGRNRIIFSSECCTM